MPAIISIIGHSKSGKTTLIIKLVEELKSRGYRVATIKHTPHEVTFDQPGKDSWRHLQTGSEAAVISARDKIVLIKPTASPATLDEIAGLLGEDYDIILAEGFKQGNAPKIEVHRQESGPLLTGIKKLIAIATDEPLTTQVRQFSLNDAKGLADFLEQDFIAPRGDRLSLYVNNAPVSLSVFPKEFIANILVAMAASLKGVGEVESLQIFLRKRLK